MIIMDNIHVDIGKMAILHGVDIFIQPGEFVALLGRNGAGKTTILRTFMGLWRAKMGQITIQGDNITHKPTHQIASQYCGYVPEDMGIFTQLSVMENILLADKNAQSPTQIHPERLEFLLNIFPILRENWGKMAGHLSGGQKQMLSIARALITPKPILLIDEPTKGLAPPMVEGLAVALEKIHASGVTIIMVEQNWHFAKYLCRRAIIINDGRAVHSANMDGLTPESPIIQTYCGF